MPDQLFDLTGRVAFVSGASRGLGAQFAKAIARNGAHVIVTSRDIAGLETTIHEVEAQGVDCLPLVLDVREQESIKAAVDQAITKFSKIDILVNNAGCNVRKPALEISWQDWNTVLDTNLRGVFFLAQAIGRHMVAAKYGRIVNIGSVTSVHAYAGLGPYCASRGGTKQLTMSLADDWGPSGVTVNCLAPGWFKTAQNAVMYEDQEWVDYLTDRIPLRRPGQQGDLDGTLLYLCSEASAYVTGQTILVDGGISTGAVRAVPKSRSK